MESAIEASLLQFEIDALHRVLPFEDDHKHEENDGGAARRREVQLEKDSADALRLQAQFNAEDDDARRLKADTDSWLTQNATARSIQAQFDAEKTCHQIRLDAEFALTIQ